MNIETLTVKQICNYIAVINKMTEENLIKFNPNKACVQFNYDKVTKYLEKQNIEQKKQIEEYEKQLEAYENVRKEAINYINQEVAVYAFNNKNLPHWEFNDENITDLLNILNKVGENNE